MKAYHCSFRDCLFQIKKNPKCENANTNPQESFKSCQIKILFDYGRLLLSFYWGMGTFQEKNNN